MYVPTPLWVISFSYSNAVHWFPGSAGFMVCVSNQGYFFPNFASLKKLANFFFSLVLPKLANLDEIKLLWKHRFGPKFLL